VQASKQRSLERSETRRFSVSSVQQPTPPDTSGSSLATSLTPSAQHARTRAFVAGSSAGRRLLKCPSAPSLQEGQGRAVHSGQGGQGGLGGEQW
jgi:hypothetical protein